MAITVIIDRWKNIQKTMIIDGDNVAFKLNGKLYHCALDITMDYIGGKVENRRFMVFAI
jgi:hypothetical protein